MVKNKTSLTGEKVTESFQEATKVLRNKAYEKRFDKSIRLIYLRKSDYLKIKELALEAPALFNDLMNDPKKHIDMLPEDFPYLRFRFLAKSHQLLMCTNPKISSQLLDQFVEADQTTKEPLIKRIFHNPNTLINFLIGIVIVLFVFGFIPLIFMKASVINLLISAGLFVTGFVISMLSSHLVKMVQRNGDRTPLMKRVNKLNQIYQKYDEVR